MSTPVSPILERIDVFPLPDLVPPGYRPEAVFFIDVLRATTTITAALAAGAEQVIPVMEPAQALNMKRILEESDPQKKGKILLGGERKGVRIEGFDLGNSPSSYTPDLVGGKTIIFSTTNGTRAVLTFERISALPPEGAKEEKRRRGGPSLRRQTVELPAAGRTRMFLGSFLNAAALVERLAAFRSVGIVCSGTELHYTEEDVLLAGLVVSRLLRPRADESRGTDKHAATPNKAGEAGMIAEPFPRPLLNVQAETAKYLWESFLETTAPERLEKDLSEKLLASRGGENLRRIRLHADIRDAARLDRIDSVPEYALGRIRLS
ncbi:MAG: 2-phosphosulfolactate phosphatase [Thermoguttaceae bacterium]|nr:2-phosphosulfolactate phosphatase [Thermoguttaceae bacterium]